MGRLLRILGACVAVGYPILVWRGLETQSPRRVALVMLAVLVPLGIFRAMTVVGRADDAKREHMRTHLRGLAVLPFISLGSLVAASVLNSLGMILIVPAFINAVLLVVFGSTLRRGTMPIVERFALLQVDELTPEQAAWCRMWTKLWCAFFVINGAIAALTAAYAPLKVWAFYNGLLSYGLLGSMFATEWILRHRRFPEIREAQAGAGEG